MGGKYRYGMYFYNEVMVWVWYDSIHMGIVGILSLWSRRRVSVVILLIIIMKLDPYYHRAYIHVYTYVHIHRALVFINTYSYVYGYTYASIGLDMVGGKYRTRFSRGWVVGADGWWGREYKKCLNTLL